MHRPGQYTLRAGVRTADGTLYEPVSMPILIEPEVDTEIVVEVVLPPSVFARFESAGEPVRGSLISAFQNGEEAFQFRWMDEVFVKEGTYTFRASPNKDNQIELTEIITRGARQELLFTLTPTVRATFKMLATGSNQRLRGNYTLWQQGEERYKVHAHNGADIQPGTYDVHLQNDLIPFVAEQVEVKNDGEIVLEVPAGHVTFIYQDASGNRVDDKRVFIGRGPDRQSNTMQSGQQIALIPGTYNAKGWPARNNYTPIVFEVKAGETQEVVFKAQR